MYINIILKSDMSRKQEEGVVNIIPELMNFYVSYIKTHLKTLQAAF